MSVSSLLSRDNDTQYHIEIICLGTWIPVFQVLFPGKSATAHSLQQIVHLDNISI